ncbi:alpha/beta fold hydrolase [Rhodococcus sp. G-MC3]|uniref:alpha/beta fold hydrolase n=1 Tax=Rhodococcus sp. G-MC3 TaxID=3046209 RepID=UPI0024B92EF3|nr:alpha/beta fold hydrolase [Rhodococcus sp. G-MC3]MDJ0393650.1 alpha/beta fold hydrolase [Rhodococcus sp. G-MC3]
MKSIYKSDTGAETVRQRYREVLSAWPVPSEERRIDTTNGETFVVISGTPDAPPLVLLHGSGANAGTWMADIDSWATHFRVYAVDLLGEAGGSAPVRLPLDSDALASWMDEVLDALDVDSASFVGMSLGGWTALDYAIRRPSRVNRLSLLCPGGIGKQTMGWLPKMMLLQLLGAKGRRRSVALVTGMEDSRYSQVLDEVDLTFTHFRPRTDKLPIFSDDDLRGLSIPVQVIVGDRDVMFDSAETARRAREFVRGAAVTVLPGVGHAVLEQTESVLTFLSS